MHLALLALACLTPVGAGQSQPRTVEPLPPISAAQPDESAGGRESYPKIVATVNGVPIPGVDLERMLTAAAPRQQLIDELGNAEPDHAALEALALHKLVQRSLILEEAARRDLTITEADLDRAIVALRRQFEDLTAFGIWMKTNGVDERSMFRAIRENMLVAKTTAALVENERVVDAAVREYYETHAEQLRFEEAWIQIIVVESAEAAAELQAALAEGDDFGALARRHSLGQRAAQSGDLGWVETDTLPALLRDAIAELAPGQAIGPLERSDEEFLIVRLEQRRPGLLKTLAEARPQIEALLLAGQQQAALRDWLAKQEAAAEIELFPATE